MYDNRRLNGMHFRQRTALTVNCEWQTLQDIKSLCIEKRMSIAELVNELSITVLEESNKLEKRSEV